VKTVWRSGDPIVIGRKEEEGYKMEDQGRVRKYNQKVAHEPTGIGKKVKTNEGRILRVRKKKRSQSKGHAGGSDLL